MLRYGIFKAAFELLSLSGISPLVRQASKARGLIFTLHRVLPQPPRAFSPNAILQITPDFLEAVIVKARASGFDIVDLDEAMTRVASAEPAKPFVVLTFDDAYRDNLEFALPILKKHGAPFTLYVPTALVDGIGDVWWQALEDVIADHDVIVIPDAAGPKYLDAATLDQKLSLFADLYAHFRAVPEDQRVSEMAALAERYDFDRQAHCRSLIMDWNELATFNDEPLCTLGAHTVHHYELSKLPLDQAKSEMEQSAAILEAQFGKRPAHFSYPIGSPVAAGEREFAMAKAIGFSTAVTTRPGGLYAENGARPEALPRVSLNGQFQKQRYIDVLLTPAFFTLATKA